MTDNPPLLTADKAREIADNVNPVQLVQDELKEIRRCADSGACEKVFHPGLTDMQGAALEGLGYKVEHSVFAYLSVHVNYTKVSW